MNIKVGELVNILNRLPHAQTLEVTGDIIIQEGPLPLVEGGALQVRIPDAGAGLEILASPDIAPPAPEPPAQDAPTEPPQTA